MASKIMLNPAGVNTSISGLSQCMARLGNVQSGIAGLRSSVDGRILARHGIGSRFAAANSSMSKIHSKVGAIRAFADDSLNKYATAESRMKNKAAEVEKETNLLQTAVEERWASTTYDTYQNIAGKIGDFLHAAQYSVGPGIAHLLGFRFLEAADKTRYFHLADDVMLFGKRIPLGSAIKAIEGSRAHTYAKYLVGGLPGLLFHGKKPLSEHLYRRLTNVYPTNVANLFNSVDALKIDYRNIGFSAVKGHAGSIVKNGLKMVRSNALLAGVITAGTETFSAGIKISENYRLYSGDVERLKTENAKVVASATYKTGVVTATSLGGAALGGAIGSFAGPVGTVVGATIGGYLGSVLGDKIAAKTPAFIENGFVAAKDQIHAVTEGVRSGYNAVKEGVSSGYNAVKEGVKDVKETAGKMVSGAKEAAGDFFKGAGKLFSFGG